MPSLSNSKDGVITPHLADWLRHFKGLTGLKGIKPHRKILVLRPGAKTRRITNSHELILSLKGWETVALETMTIREQMKTFAEATHIVAAHGAGLVNFGQKTRARGASSLDRINVSRLVVFLRNEV